MGMLALRVKITKFEVKSTTTSRSKIPITYIVPYFNFNVTESRFSRNAFHFYCMYVNILIMRRYAQPM